MIIEEKYHTPVGVYDRVEVDEEKAIRLVLTGKCNLACEFCIYKTDNFFSAEVKSPNLCDMKNSKKLVEILEMLSSELGYNTIHLTGGEPTMCSDIEEIAEEIKKLNLRVHMVTNLVDIEKIESLINKNLIDELTFSYVPKDRTDLNERIESLKNYKTSSNSRNKVIKKNIEMLRNKYPKLIIKTNIVCSGLTNIDDCVEFVNWCWNINVKPRMQRDRSSDRIEGSTKAVNEVLSTLNMEKTFVTLRVPGATEICRFKDDLKRDISVKVFNQNFRPDSICDECDLEFECDKALSSIRIFNKKTGPEIAMCTKIDESFCILDRDEFLTSNVFSELYFYKLNPKKYFEKFCYIKNHQ